jgi:hypothetical protein
MLISASHCIRKLICSSAARVVNSVRVSCSEVGVRFMTSQYPRDQVQSRPEITTSHRQRQIRDKLHHVYR